MNFGMMYRSKLKFYILILMKNSISEKESMIKKRSDNILDIIGNFNTPDFIVQNETIQKSNKSKSNSFDKDKNKDDNYLTCIT